MKSKELIQQLQKLDPTGETEVCVGNTPIYFVESKPAYYDGVLKTLIHDEPKVGKEFSIIGMKYIIHGEKLHLNLFEVDDLIGEDPEAFVDLSDLDEIRRERIGKQIEDLRQCWRKWHAENPRPKTQETKETK